MNKEKGEQDGRYSCSRKARKEDARCGMSMRVQVGTKRSKEETRERNGNGNGNGKGREGNYVFLHFAATIEPNV